LTKTVKSIILILGVYVALLLMDVSSGHEHHYTLCVFKNITGIPCPGCGMGRGTLALFRGDFSGAFFYNILCIPFSFCVLIALIWLFFDLVKRRETFFLIINRPVRFVYLIPLFILTIISWVVNILRAI